MKMFSSKYPSPNKFLYNCILVSFWTDKIKQQFITYMFIYILQKKIYTLFVVECLLLEGLIVYIQ